MNMKHVLKLLALLTGLLGSQFCSAQSDAVVKIVCTQPDGSLRSGSGVCVDREGVILTASHVIKNGTCRVYLQNRVYPARPVVVPPGEGVAVIKVESADELPSLEIAESQPEVGDDVWVMGFPNGKWSSYRTTVTSDKLFFADDRSTQLIGVFDPVLFGNSGGPLVTRDWKVAGIASVSGKIPPSMTRVRTAYETVRISGTALERTGGMFLALRHVRDAYETYLESRESRVERQEPEGQGREIPALGLRRSNLGFSRPILYAFTSAHCEACRRFKQDYHSGKFNHFDVRVIEHGSAKWPTAVAEIERYTRQPVPNAVPFFWIWGSRHVVQQRRYSAPGLLQILAEILKGLGRIIFNPEIRPDTSHSSPELELNDEEPPPDNSVEKFGWSLVKVIVLAAEQNVGSLRGSLRKQALSLSVGPLRRKLSEITGGKAEFDLVAERLTPDRFAATVKAAGVSPEPISIVALVARQDLGLAKGLIVRKIEEALTGKFQAAPVEVIFERLHPVDYAAVLNALQIQETNLSGASAPSQPERKQIPVGNDPMDPRNTIPTLAVAWLAERITTKLKRRFAK